MASKANGSQASAEQADAPNGRLREKLDNKTEAVRRALDELGWDAKPRAIKEHVKTYYGVDISPKVVSVYKGKLTRGRKRGKRGRKTKAEAAAVPAVAASRTGGPRGGRDAAIDVGVLTALKELSARVGPGKLQELVELLPK